MPGERRTAKEKKTTIRNQTEKERERERETETERERERERKERERERERHSLQGSSLLRGVGASL